MTTIEHIEDFAAFAKTQIVDGGERSIDDLYEDWRQRTFLEQDALAIHASLRDLENGERGRPAEVFLAEFDSECRKSEP